MEEQIKLGEEQARQNEEILRRQIAILDAAEREGKRQSEVLDTNVNQIKRFDAVIQKWEEQAKRYDAILARWEQQTPPVPSGKEP